MLVQGVLPGTKHSKPVKQLHSAQALAARRCPGVFGHEASACGAPLLFHALPMASPGDLAGLWRCAKAPECEFVEYPPQRLLSPLLTLEALSLSTFRVRFLSCPGVQSKCQALANSFHLMGWRLLDAMRMD